MKKIFIDLETTGTDPQKNGVWQISGLIEIDNIQMQTFDIKTDVYKNDIISDEALKVGDITTEDLRTYGSPEKHFKDFINLLDSYVDKYNKNDKFYFIGYNSTFDMNFLRNWFLKANHNYFGSYFFFPDIDVMRVAAYYFLQKGKRPINFKLSTVAKFLGIEVKDDSLHDALYDIELTKHIYEILRGIR